MDAIILGDIYYGKKGDLYDISLSSQSQFEGSEGNGTLLYSAPPHLYSSSSSSSSSSYDTPTNPLLNPFHTR